MDEEITDSECLQTPRKVLHLTEKPDSVTIKETAKGDLYFEVKCYGDTSTDEDELTQRAKRIYKKLVEEMREK